ncbi:hypothetical protein CBS101457_000246 [Exobasidium rhododendri]|nr:hypothetical protein CBS101457_000246 [Exobasidium rhododendri]
MDSGEWSYSTPVSGLKVRTRTRRGTSSDQSDQYEAHTSRVGTGSGFVDAATELGSRSSRTVRPHGKSRANPRNADHGDDMPRVPRSRRKATQHDVLEAQAEDVDQGQVYSPVSQQVVGYDYDGQPIYYQSPVAQYSTPMSTFSNHFESSGFHPSLYSHDLTRLMQDSSSNALQHMQPVPFSLDTALDDLDLSHTHEEQGSTVHQAPSSPRRSSRRKQKQQDNASSYHLQGSVDEASQHQSADFELTPFPAQASSRRGKGKQVDPILDVWRGLHLDIQERLARVLSKYRARSYDTTVEKLDRALTFPVARALLDSDPQTVLWAVEQVDPMVPDGLYPMWMSGLSDAEGDRLIEDLCHLSGNDEYVVRNTLRLARVTPEMIKTIFYADEYGLQDFAAQLGLLQENMVYDKSGRLTEYRGGNRDHPWQFCLNKIQRDHVVNLILKALPYDRKWVLQQLRQRHIWAGFGRDLYEANREQAVDLIHYLQHGLPRET